MLGEWGTFGVYVIGFAAFWLFTSHRARKRFDSDGNGKIDPDEVPFLIRTIHLPCRLNKPKYMEMSILSLYRVLVEAMLHAFSYGCTVVFTMNLIMLNFNMDERYAYLMVCMLIFMACMFMCSVATNGIHVATSLEIHFLYYGFAFSSLGFLWNTPETIYLVALAAISKVIIYLIGRNYSLPSYPGVHETCRLYKYSEEDDEWKLASIPDYFSSTSDTLVPNLVGQLPSFPPPGTSYLIWAVVFPVYEIGNTLFSSAFAIGILVGTAIYKLVGFETASTKFLVISALLAGVVVFTYQSFGLYGRNENKMHKMVMANFLPKTAATIIGMFGGAAVVIQLIGNTEGASTVAYYVSVAALAMNILLTFGLSIVAKSYHISAAGQI